MAKSPLLQKNAKGSGWNICDPNGGVSGEGKTRDGLNQVLKMCQSARNEVQLKTAAWVVTITDGKKDRTEQVNGQSYKGAERAVQPKLRKGESIRSITIASVKKAAGVQECCGAFAPKHKENCEVYNKNFDRTIQQLKGLKQGSEKVGPGRFLTIAEVKEAYEQGKKEGRFVETAAGITDTKDGTFIPWSEEEKARGRGMEGDTGDYDFYKSDPGSVAGEEEWIAMKEMGIIGKAKNAATEDDVDNPMCICGHRFYDHNEQGYCDFCDPDSATKGPTNCGGFTPLNEPLADVHLGSKAAAFDPNPYVQTAREIIALRQERAGDPSSVVEPDGGWESMVQDMAAATGLDGDYLNDALHKELARRAKSAARPTGINPQHRNEQSEMEQEHPGAVCSDCGRTVTNGEYSYGGSNCCKADVVPEEQYGMSVMAKSAAQHNWVIKDKKTVCEHCGMDWDMAHASGECPKTAKKKKKDAEDEEGAIVQQPCPLCGHVPVYREAKKSEAPHKYYCHACCRGFDEFKAATAAVKDPCPKCKGKGKLPFGKGTCSACGGTGSSSTRFKGYGATAAKIRTPEKKYPDSLGCGSVPPRHVYAQESAGRYRPPGSFSARRVGSSYKRRCARHRLPGWLPRANGKRPRYK